MSTGRHSVNLCSVVFKGHDENTKKTKALSVALKKFKKATPGKAKVEKGGKGNDDNDDSSSDSEDGKTIAVPEYLCVKMILS